MARIRTVKPEFWSSPDTAACEDPWARLLFVAMWNWADDNGRGTANPKELGGFAFPNDDKIEPADVRRMLGGIRRAFGVDFYVIDGRPYYSIPSWDKHQKIDKRGTGKYPGPERGEPWDPDPGSPPDLRRSGGNSAPAGPSEESPESTRSPRRMPGAGTGEQGNRGTGEQGKTDTLDSRPAGGELVLVQPQPPAAPAERAPARRTPGDPPGFDQFWNACPRKVGKGKARDEYRKAVRAGATPEALRTAMEAAATFWRRSQTESRYIPHPATWLSQSRWEDDTSRPEAPAGSTTARIESGDAALAEFRRRRGIG